MERIKPEIRALQQVQPRRVRLSVVTVNTDQHADAIGIHKGERLLLKPCRWPARGSLVVFTLKYSDVEIIGEFTGKAFRTPAHAYAPSEIKKVIGLLILPERRLAAA